MGQGIPSYPAPPALQARRTSLATTLRPALALTAEVLASLLAGGLLLVAYRQPWWSLRLYAPQYPRGLGVEILLSGARGDIREIDTLNHYIGMASLSTAAPLERQLSFAAIAAASLLVSSLLLVRRRGANLVAVATLLAVPLGFIADFWYWLHRFGHQLNPHAPLRLQPFTPELFGNGVIGQFMTFARPELGFWLALGAAGLATLLLLLRSRQSERLGKRS